MEWPADLDEYEKLVLTMAKPRIVVDNHSCSSVTLVMIDGARTHGILLEAVQVLTYLNLWIQKAYISSDGKWFLDVFHVTDMDGNKLIDEGVISNIEKSLGTIHYFSKPSKCIDGLTALEITATDRAGLLSDVFAILADLHVDVVESKVWTHNGRIAALIYVEDCCSGFAIEDKQKIDSIVTRLRCVLKGDNDIRRAQSSVSFTVTHTERRLHQMMFADMVYDRNPVLGTICDSPIVSVQKYLERGYSVVNIVCKERTKLLFDVVCTLTDMDFIVFHATAKATGDQAHMEFFIRHVDGTPISSQSEKQCVVLCLQAAIKRRASEGLQLELCADDKAGLLADVTRTFRENGLNVTRAEISTTFDVARDVFYVTDPIGNPCDPGIIKEVQQKISHQKLKVKEVPLMYHDKEEQGEEPTTSMGGEGLVSLGRLVRRNLIKSCVGSAVLLTVGFLARRTLCNLRL